VAEDLLVRRASDGVLTPLAIGLHGLHPLQVVVLFLDLLAKLADCRVCTAMLA
jgi:hypothetical protein